MKKILYRQLKKARVEVVNRVVGTRILKDAEGKAAGLMGFDCRTGDWTAQPAGRLISAVAGFFRATWFLPLGNDPFACLALWKANAKW